MNVLCNTVSGCVRLQKETQCVKWPLNNPWLIDTRGTVILLAESRRGLKKVTENPEKPKKFCGKPEKHLCWKPENYIFKSWKPGKIGKYGRNQEAQFKIRRNLKSPFGSCGKLEKPQKTMKSCGNRKIRKKKPRKAGKGRYFLRKTGKKPPIT